MRQSLVVNLTQMNKLVVIICLLLFSLAWTELTSANDTGSSSTYAEIIMQKIQRNWLWHPSWPNGARCTVQVVQKKTGEVVSVKIVECENHALFAMSVERAVWVSSPLPLPKSQNDFSPQLTLVFVVNRE